MTHVNFVYELIDGKEVYITASGEVVPPEPEVGISDYYVNNLNLTLDADEAILDECDKIRARIEDVAMEQLVNTYLGNE